MSLSKDTSVNTIQCAALFAQEAHSGQYRKYTNRPYIEHPMRVAGRVTLTPGMNEDHVVAAWLHDTVEDTDVTLTDIEDGFGRTVASYVRYLTNPSKQRLDCSRVERKRIDREFIAQAPPLVRAIKLIDRIDNLLDMSGATSGFLRLYKSESLLLLQAIVKENDCEAVKQLGKELEGLLH